eukprot:scaffold43142_cov19-Tisochrysis_lutea.AAC.2
MPAAGLASALSNPASVAGGGGAALSLAMGLSQLTDRGASGSGGAGSGGSGSGTTKLRPSSYMPMLMPLERLARHQVRTVLGVQFCVPNVPCCASCFALGGGGGCACAFLCYSMNNVGTLAQMTS